VPFESWPRLPVAVSVVFTGGVVLLSVRISVVYGVRVSVPLLC
jgi:hypothetical protein